MNSDDDEISTSEYSHPALSTVGAATDHNRNPTKKSMNSIASVVATTTAPSTAVADPSFPQPSDTFDIILPSSIGTKSGDCTLLVQMEPKDAALLELEGANGAIGRLETDNDNNTLTLDLKGHQFSGHIYPGPTVLVVTLNSKAGMLKVDGVTDEFVHLVKKRKRGLDAVVTGDADAGRYLKNIGRDDDDSEQDETSNYDDDDDAKRTHPSKTPKMVKSQKRKGSAKSNNRGHARTNTKKQKGSNGRR